MICHTILFVADQKRSADFYREFLGFEPTLDVPGMTEFRLGPNSVLGLMPESGIKRILGDTIQNSGPASRNPRSEIYLKVQYPQEYFDRAIELGAKILSPLQPRNWGDTASYIMDPDGHLVVVAGVTIVDEP